MCGYSDYCKANVTKASFKGEISTHAIMYFSLLLPLSAQHYYLVICVMLFVKLVKVTFPGSVVSCRPGVGGFSGTRPAEPEQLIFSPLHPNTQTIFKRTATGRQSCRRKENFRINIQPNALL